MNALRGARVLLVGGYPPPHGGIAVHVQTLRERLLEGGAQVKVLDLGRKNKYAADSGVHPVAGPWPLAMHLGAHFVRNYLIHAHVSGHTPKSWLIASAVAAARPPWAPRPVLTLHSGLMPNYLQVSEARQRFARLVAKGYGRIITVNTRLREYLQGIGIGAAKMMVMPALVAFPKPGEAPSVFASIRQVFNPLLASAVSKSPIYGTRVLLPALSMLTRRLPQVGLALMGPADAGRLRELARRYAVEDRVFFLGEMAHSSALAVMKGSDIFIRPSLADGDALCVREALMLNRPVIASAVGFRPRGVILFRNGDAVDLAEKIENRARRGFDLHDHAGPRLLDDQINDVSSQGDQENMELLFDIYRNQLPKRMIIG